MTTLYDIHGAIASILLAAEDNEGELTPEMLAELDGLEMAREQKLLDCACVYLDYASEAERIQYHIERLQERKATAAKNAERVKGYILAHATPGEKLNDCRVALGWRKSTQVVIEDENQLPPDCWRMKEPEPDKKSIGEKLKAGAVPGARLQENQNLQIK